MKRAAPYFLRSGKQLAALTAAARQEIVDVLEQMGAVPVAELAAALNRPADALYFHLRALTRAGLVENAGFRSRNGRKEAIYRTVVPQVKLQYEPQDPANRKAISAIVASMLRLGTRDFARSFQPGNVVVSGPRRELWALRRVGRISPAQLAKVNRGIQRLADEVSVPAAGSDAAGGSGRLYAVTILLTPLDHRNNKFTRPQPKKPAERKKK